jgi:hypothetical protein
MSEILIKYRDGSGEITERRISDLRLENATTIDAFCHLRKARRPFKMDHIIQAINPDTGEVINPYNLVGVSSTGTTRPSIESLLWQAMPAIKALKFFTLSTRGFRQRERDRVEQFVKEVGDLSAYSKEEIGEWVYKLWCGDLYAYRDGNTTEYTEILQNIPSTLLNRCRDYALLIARGSGRKPVDPIWLKRIETEFNSVPQVKKPEKNEVEGISVTISAQLPKLDSGEY